MSIKHRSKWLWEKTDGHCAYCGTQFETIDDMTTDHLQARARGGDNSRANKFPCCRSCNSSKNHRPLSYLRDVLQRRYYDRPAFSAAQIAYLALHGITLPPEAPYRFFWERMGHSFPAEGGE